MGSYAPEYEGLELDRTLYDLYKQDNENGEVPDLAFMIPSGTTSLTSGLPAPTKYAYQAPRAQKVGPDIMARICLTVGPTYMSFMAGKMRINFFNPDQHKNEPNGDANYRIHQLDTLNTFAQLPEHQRPEVDFVYGPGEIECEEKTKVAFLTPMDCFADMPHLVDPDTHYELLSKRELAVSTLPSPKTELIDCNLTADEVEDNSLVDAEVTRFVSAVEEAVPPFVVKLPQGLAGQGVYVVHKQSDQSELLKTLGTEVKTMIQSINSENEHLHPACLMVQQMIAGTAVALSFFITKTGNAIFTGCCEQEIDSKGAWAGAVINYPQQKAIEARYTDIMQQMAKYVHGRGYWGPMGADVMTDLDGKQLVIDLNVRVAGSYILGFLKNHLSVKRGLDYAGLLYPLPLKGTRADFEKMFEPELSSGKLLIAGWCHGRAGPWGIVKYSIASVVAAAQDPEELRTLSDRVNARRIRK